MYLLCVGAKAAALTCWAFICSLSGHTLFFVYVTALPRPAGIVRPSARIDFVFLSTAGRPPPPLIGDPTAGAHRIESTWDGGDGVRGASPFLRGARRFIPSGMEMCPSVRT